jgi:outer membrane protein assembly factor BamA
VFRLAGDRLCIRLETRLSGAPAEADVDSDAIKQALINPNDNAMKYSGSGKEEKGILMRKTPLLLTASALLLAAVLSVPPLLAQRVDTRIEDRSYKSWSALPILMYDPDIGFGYGAKARFVDFLGVKESFDLILFNSSKGERWYVFTFQIPDIEIRQGKTYPISFDLKAEYDKYLNYSYYGLGMDSRTSDETILTHETKNLQLTFGRGFTPNFILEASYVFRTIDYYDVRPGPLESDLESLDRKSAPYVSVLVRHDTSNSQIHPTRGVRLIFQSDLANGLVGSKDARFYRFTLDFRRYQLVFGERDVLAYRLLVQYVGGSSIPLFDHSSLGGGGTMNCMRGYSLNRFLDKGKLLANIEYRFPIFWRFGGNAFVDAGNVFPSFDEVPFAKTAVDAGLGLRFYMPDFAVRVDVGFSKETMGLYFNFNHVF